jgi:hypothetical protein
MRRLTRTLTATLILAGLLMPAACHDAASRADTAKPAMSRPGAAAFDQRAAQLVRDWPTTATAAAWNTALIRLQTSIIPPVWPGTVNAAKYLAGPYYRLATKLPGSRKSRGTVTFADGSSMSVCS